MMVIGFGNRFRRDDGIGPCVLDYLRRDPETPQGVHLFEAEREEVVDLMEAVQGQDRVVVVDSCPNRGHPGRLHLLQAPEKLEDFHYLSQDVLDLLVALERSRSLGVVTPRVFFLLVEGEDFSWGQGLSPRVQGEIPRIVDAVKALLNGG